MPTLPTRGLLKRGSAENAALFVGRAVLQAVEAQAEFIHFDLKQHYLVIRLRWSSRMRMTWRGSRGEGLEVMAYLKGAAGMDSSASRINQAGDYPFVFGDKSILLPAVCKPYITAEQVVLELPPLVRATQTWQEEATEGIASGEGVHP